MFLTQDVPQYNQAFARAAAVIQARQPGAVIERIDVPRPSAAEPEAGPVGGYDAVVSIGTPALEAALTVRPDDRHVCSMIVTLDPRATRDLPAATRARLQALSILPHPASYIRYAAEIQDLRAMGLLYASDAFDDYVTALGHEAAALGIDVEARKIGGQSELVAAFDQVVRSNIDTFLFLPDFSLYDMKAIEYVILNTFKRGISCIGPSENFVTSGALWSFVIDPAELGDQLGALVVDGTVETDDGMQHYRPSTVALNALVMEKLDVPVPFRIRRTARIIDPRTRNEE